MKAYNADECEKWTGKFTRWIQIDDIINLMHESTSSRARNVSFSTEDDRNGTTDVVKTLDELYGT